MTKKLPITQFWKGTIQFLILFCWVNLTVLPSRDAKITQFTAALSFQNPADAEPPQQYNLVQ